MLKRSLVIICLLLFIAGGDVSKILAAETAVAPALSKVFYRVTEYGAVGDGKTKDTLSIQKAVDAANQRGGGTVYFPPGIYLSGTIRLKDNVTLYLDTGVTLLGSTDVKDYPIIWPEFRSYTDNYVYQSLIYGEKVKNVAIVGRGTIDGRGDKFERHYPGRQYGQRPYLVRLVSCEKILVEGITLLDSPMWVQQYLACDDLVIDGIKVHSYANHNNDGIDIDCCRYVRISNCYIDSLDDAIVLKSTADRPCENVTVTNCVLSSNCNGFKLGTESNGGFKNITFSNSAIYDVGICGIALELVDGGVLDRVTVSNITMHKVGGAIFCRLGNRARPFKKDMEKPGMGSFRNVIISNVVATGVNHVGSSITGLPGHPVENISLSNIKITYAGGGTKKDALRKVPEVAEKYPEYKMFGVLPAYGFYCRHVEGLSFSDIDVHWNRPDYRPALVCDDVKNLDIDRYKGQCLSDGLPLIVFNDVEGALIQGCVAPAGVKSFLKLQGFSSRISVTGNDLSGAAVPFEFSPDLAQSILYTSGNRMNKN